MYFGRERKNMSTLTGRRCSADSWGQRGDNLVIECVS